MPNALLDSIRQYLDRAVINSLSPSEPVEQALSLSMIFGQIERSMWDDDAKPGWLLDIYVDETEHYAIIGHNGRLYKAAIAIDQDTASIPEMFSWERVMVEHVPVAQTPDEDSTTTPASAISIQEPLPLFGQSSFTIHQQADGTHRWVAIAATAILNRSGTLNTRQLYDYFVEDIDQTGEYPDLRFFHLEDQTFRLGMTDFVARDGYCYLASGTFDTDQLLTQPLIDDVSSDPTFWGVSIGFRATQGVEFTDFGGINIPTFKAGTNHEISVLPETDAACLNTGFAVMQHTREGNEMDPRIVAALQRLNVDTEVIEEGVDQANELAEDPEVVSQSTNELSDDQADPVAQDEDSADENEEDGDDITVQELADGLLAVTTTIEAQNEAIVDAFSQTIAAFEAFQAVVTQRLGDLEATQAEANAAEEQTFTERMAELSPIVAHRLQVNHRPRQARNDEATGTGQRPKTMEQQAEGVLANLPTY